ncbi:MAG: efflux RND transporter periplasmic adaptor subunit [Marinilabiliales bacterium]|nr:efflux RND transporter periplasmic adaptor subunit [Marinilabiliales bacterium]
MKKSYLYTGGALLIVIIGYFAFTKLKSAEQTYSFETVKIGKGTISNTVTATGTIEAIKTVSVGTQVSGVIEKIYVDFNSVVKKGQLLAQLDETPLQAQLDQSKATVDQAESQLKYQKATFDRYKALIAKKLIAQSDYDLAEYNYNNAIASLKNAKSVYDKNKINLAYARIYSPIDGVILNRAVDEGQTVAASFNTPTLFSIANDLTQMRVEAKIDEADIGQIAMNQRVEFTVDAFPDMKFAGAVSEIRKQPTVTSNVVTYTVIIQAPNPESKLLPGMTASTTIYVNEKKEIAVVPGKALRFVPEPEVYSGYLKSLPGDLAGKMAPTILPKEKADPKTGYVWLKHGPIIREQEVKIGDNDGINYELISGLEQGEEVVLSMAVVKLTSETKKAARSPFMPQRPGGSRR